MGYPKHQWVLCRVRGNKTQFFYGTKLGDLVTQHIKVGDDFGYAKLTTSKWRVGSRTSQRAYSTAA